MNKEINGIIADSKRIKLNLGCGQDIRPTEQGWVNMDSIEHENILKADIFALPFPFDDNTFDLVLAKHVLEHVPHNLPSYGYTHNFLQLLVEEIWRIMKPDGLFHIEVPQGLCSLIDGIDHKRTITPHTFHIFYPDDPWNYYSDCRFEIASGHEKIGTSFRLLRLLLGGFFNVDIDPLRIRPSSFELRKLPKNERSVIR
jgi:SAM-dependent methyltransferase